MFAKTFSQQQKYIRIIIPADACARLSAECSLEGLGGVPCMPCGTKLSSNNNAKSNLTLTADNLDYAYNCISLVQ